MTLIDREELLKRLEEEKNEYYMKEQYDIAYGVLEAISIVSTLPVEAKA